MTTWTIRHARQDDLVVAELQRGSAPGLVDRVFGSDAVRFLQRDFLRGGGVYGYRNQIVATTGGGDVVASCTAYRGRDFRRLSAITTTTVLQHYRLAAPGVLRRLLVLSAAFAPPAPDGLLLANFCTARKFRGGGAGTALLEHLLSSAAGIGARSAELDVSTENTAAERWYTRLGFELVGERRHALGADGFRRMRRTL
ncbi:GNAT family N-acetyltransferase [Lentzea sp. E54]|uniref:GNAT family N-acetyltransferase n=1 Tax=Lentzea xerophila TaxID=3435883 RepID=UPI003DA3E59E